MIEKNILGSLCDQIKLEGIASMQYLAFASWAESEGLNGVATFFYSHAAEENGHMIKLIKFVNERGELAKIPTLEGFETDFKDLGRVLKLFLESEQEVTQHVNKITSQCLEKKDYITHNFMQWYVAEQMEEESLAQDVIDKFNLIDGNNGALYLFDRDIMSIGGHGKGE
ncbi:ferritin [Elysia marginata]|uniref:Ferritin n=1 Tax=Elysia marginata TaxID=1093978 RepID=A0AAV4G5H2_9GAST|nr:ferritin [Elysia marginata]